MTLKVAKAGVGLRPPEYPGVVKLADTSDLGSDPRGYGFKSLRPDQRYTRRKNN